MDSKRTLRSLGTRNWDLAQKKILALEATGDKTRKTILDATESFVRDAEARGLRTASDTFAVELLLARVPLVEVSALLGHQSIKVTQTHYAPWVIERQEQLEKSVRTANERYNQDTSANQQN